MTSPRDRTTGRMARVAAIAWIAAIAGGSLAIHAYEATPGEPGRAVLRWPAEVRVPLAGDRPTLVMAIHPWCPCTRASAAELARALASCEGRVSAYALICTPRDAVPARGNSEYISSLSAIPGVRVVDDPDGIEARRFDARTSGQVALYSPDGRLLFRGGITRARGQEGPNAGLDAVIAALRGQPGGYLETPVFGCPIF